MNSQKSLKDQLDELDQLAAKHGLYDAQDWLRTIRNNKSSHDYPIAEAKRNGG